MSDTPNYVEYRPPADGVAPPHWREGMAWGLLPDGSDIWTHLYPAWDDDTTYFVPPEALTAPNETAGQKIERVEIIVGSKRKKEIVSLNELARLIKGGAAIYGITLEPQRDWATELWADLIESWQYPGWASDVRSGIATAADDAAVALIRERVVLKGEG